MANTTQVTLSRQNETTDKAKFIALFRILKAGLLLVVFLAVCAGLWLLATTGYSTYAIHLGATSFILGCAIIMKKATGV